MSYRVLDCGNGWHRVCVETKSEVDASKLFKELGHLEKIKLNFDHYGGWNWAVSSYKNESVKGLAITNRGMTCDWVCYLPSLRTLDLPSNAEIDGESLLKCENLEELSFLGDVKFDNFGKLSLLKNLVSLRCFDVKKLDFNSVSSHSIRELTVTSRGNPFKNQSLTGLRNLETARLYGRLKDLNFLSEAKNLLILDLDRCGAVQDFSGIFQSKLKILTLSSKKLPSLNFITQLPHLEEIYFHGKSVIEDSSLAPLLKHPKLKICEFRMGEKYYKSLEGGDKLESDGRFEFD